MALSKHTECAQCGMVCAPDEYHPYAACLMFMACRNGETVRANLEAVRGSPVVAGEPVAELVVDRFTTQLKALSAAHDVRPYGAHLLCLVPQPTQAQTGAVPLTDPQLVACIKAAGFTTWDNRMWALKREIEAAHGIKEPQ